jgi:hypothetical protein
LYSTVEELKEAFCMHNALFSFKSCQMTCVLPVSWVQYTVKSLVLHMIEYSKETYGGVSLCNDQVHVLNRDRELPLRDKRT